MTLRRECAFFVRAAISRVLGDPVTKEDDESLPLFVFFLVVISCRHWPSV